MHALTRHSMQIRWSCTERRRLVSVVGPLYPYCTYRRRPAALAKVHVPELSSGDVLAMRNPPPSTRCGGAFGGARAVR